MITKNIKQQFIIGEPVFQEFKALMNATFRFYEETWEFFFKELPRHLHQSELVSLVNVELKKRLFNPEFCDHIQDSLKSLRRAIIRLEDLHSGQPAHPQFLLDIPRLLTLSEHVEILYQRHWEIYRYSDKIGEEGIVEFLMEIHRIRNEWRLILVGNAHAVDFVQSLSGPRLPPKRIAFQVSYLRETGDDVPFPALKPLLDLLESAYRLVTAVLKIDPETTPLILTGMEVGHPVQLSLAIPQEVEAPLTKFLKYLFLQGMFKRESLLKFVFEAIVKEFSQGEPPTTLFLGKIQKELIVILKQLPADGKVSISDLTFPGDEIIALEEFTDALEQNKINFEALIKNAEGRKPAKKVKPAAPKPDTEKPIQPPTQAVKSPRPGNTESEEKDGSLQPKHYIGFLTEKNG